MWNGMGDTRPPGKSRRHTRMSAEGIEHEPAYLSVHPRLLTNLVKSVLPRWDCAFRLRFASGLFLVLFDGGVDLGQRLVLPEARSHAFLGRRE